MALITTSDEQISDEEWQRAEALETALLYGDRMPDSETAPLLAAAHRVTGLAQALAPPSLGLVRRVGRLGQEPVRPPGWRRSWRLWPAIAAVGLLIVLTAFGPGRGALASLYARLSLGAVDVSVTPDTVPVGPRFTTAYREQLADVAAAQRRVAFTVLQPQSMPDDYALQTVSAISYADMPVWFPAPFYIELDYRSPAQQAMEHELTIRQFGLALGDEGGIKNLRFAADQVAESHPVDMNGHAALMLVHQEPAGQPVRELVWQAGDVMLELLSQTLPPEEMLHIAASMK